LNLDNSLIFIFTSSTFFFLSISMRQSSLHSVLTRTQFSLRLNLLTETCCFQRVFFWKLFAFPTLLVFVLFDFDFDFLIPNGNFSSILTLIQKLENFLMKINRTSFCLVSIQFSFQNSSNPLLCPIRRRVNVESARVRQVSSQVKKREQRNSAKASKKIPVEQVRFVDSVAGRVENFMNCGKNRQKFSAK
jgi:hypothetical protein